MMNVNGENLRMILGIKLKQLRSEKNLSLKELSEATDLSISYLSEIEKGKKYPKPEKIIALARALGTTFDDLVTLKVDEALDPLAAIVHSPMLREFPFELFGIEQQDIMDLFSASPAKAGALLKTLLEIIRGYDMSVEQFILAALRSYQKIHQNYFEDLELAAERFVSEMQWKLKIPMPTELFKKTLVQKYGYDIDETSLSQYPELQKFRTVFVPPKTSKHSTLGGSKPRLLLNKDLIDRQKAFIYGRELGYNYLKLQERALTSSWLKVESFEQVLNNFKASYFSGALLMHRHSMVKDLTKLFQKRTWEPAAILAILDKYAVTPEMLLYRMTELLPKFFGLEELHFLRFSHRTSTGSMKLTKLLNMSQVFAPYGLDLNEHYCRRWLPIAILKREQGELAERDPTTPLVVAQRPHFVESDVEYFVITIARRFALKPTFHSSVSIGFLLNNAFKETVRFWNDPSIERIMVNETCERCGLKDDICRDRVAPPTLYMKNQRQRAREAVLQRILSGGHNIL
ncbi:MAG: helix-turn-helix transcriptional regulator [Bacteroidota bacterium]|nr:helix-turn-helix transcriptional regulator [Candidatus Kapabacteria bacterium]MDW8219247.1 helix-turn-helix transcriptional regulator [Bacteroidota bacterium]